MKKARTVYCDPLNYIETVHPEFGDLIQSACARGSFTSTRGTVDGGKTIVVPTKATVDSLAAKLMSSDADEVRGVNESVNAYVLRIFCLTPAQMKEASDAGTLANGSFKPKLVTVKSATAGKVTLTNGAVLSPITDFKCTKSFAMWKMDSGEMPTDGAETRVEFKKKTFAPKTGEGEKKRAAKKRGGYEMPTTGTIPKFRREIAAFVESKFYHELSAGTGNAIVEHAVSLAYFLLQSDRQFYRDMIGHSLTFAESDFYMLVEPDNFCGYFRVPEEKIQAWWAGDKFAVPFGAMTAALDAAFTSFAQDADCAVYCPTERAKLVAEVNTKRVEVCDVADSDGRKIDETLETIYNEFVKTNAIGSVTDVLPARCIEYYRGFNGLKLLHDCARYGAHFAFAEIAAGHKSLVEVSRALNAVGDAFYVNNHDDAAKFCPIVNKIALTYSISPDRAIEVARMFACSTCFMFYSMTSTEAANLRLRNTLTPPPSGKPIIHNILAAERKMHERLIEDSTMDLARSMMNFLDHVDPATMPPKMRDVLERIKSSGSK